MDQPTSWRVLKQNTNKETASEEAVFVLQGIIVSKDLPPLREKPRWDYNCWCNNQTYKNLVKDSCASLQIPSTGNFANRPWIGDVHQCIGCRLRNTSAVRSTVRRGRTRALVLLISKQHLPLHRHFKPLPDTSKRSGGHRRNTFSQGSRSERHPTKHGKRRRIHFVRAHRGQPSPIL